MKMKPHEVLLALGFDIPEDGIEVSEHDAFLHNESLRLLGKTISVDRINESDLLSLHHGLAGIVAVHRNEEPTQPSANFGDRLKGLIRANCDVTYKFRLKSEM